MRSIWRVGAARLACAASCLAWAWGCGEDTAPSTPSPDADAPHGADDADSANIDSADTDNAGDTDADSADANDLDAARADADPNDLDANDLDANDLDAEDAGDAATDAADLDPSDGGTDADSADADAGGTNTDDADSADTNDADSADTNDADSADADADRADADADAPQDLAEPVVPRGSDGRCEGEQPRVVGPPDESCQPPSPGDLSAFQPCSAGAGSFGRWAVDERGLPAYDYELDQNYDDRARWTMSDGRPRRDHFSQVGNDRAMALSTNQGFTELLVRERGVALLNRRDPTQGRTGGGYSYIREDDQAWASAFDLRPCGAESTRRRFGIGYAEHETLWDGLRVTHFVHAPYGDLSFVLDEVTIRNESARPRSLHHYEFWDVNYWPLEAQIPRSGSFDPNALLDADLERAQVLDLFELSIAREPDGALVQHRYTGATPAPPRSAPSARDYEPAPIGLRRLWPPTQDVPLRLHTDRAAFFGGGDARQPRAVQTGAAPSDLPTSSARAQPAVLVDEVALRLAPGEARTLRYAYGWLPRGKAWEDLDPWTDPSRDPRAELAQAWRPSLPLVDAQDLPHLHREMAWHAAQLFQGSLYEDYFDAHVLSQSASYLWEQGIDGVNRDFMISSVPATYLRPDLARENLRTLMRSTHADAGQISYLVQGHGVLEDGVLHPTPSDLDLFFLWGLSEYLGATGDWDFLDEPNPFWPREARPGATTLDHVEQALLHLMDTLGTGPNGLLRLGTGDWNDIIVGLGSVRSRTIAQGESLFNTHMALWVLPRAAGLVERSNPALARRVRTFTEDLAEAAEEQWVGGWYRRAWLGPQEPFGDEDIQLEAQVWPLIARAHSTERGARLREEVYARLDAPSPLGATLIEGGMMWHVIAGLLTWGYTREDPARAWESFGRHNMARHAQHLPDQWFGVWSGPDGVFTEGGTWETPFAAMTDFPMFNSNQHAMPLIEALRMAGVEPSAECDGLELAPPSFARGLRVRSALLEVDIDAQGYRGLYRAQNDGQTALYLAHPAEGARVVLDGQEVPLAPGATRTRLPLTFQEGDEITFEVWLP